MCFVYHICRMIRCFVSKDTLSPANIMPITRYKSHHKGTLIEPVLLLLGINQLLIRRWCHSFSQSLLWYILSLPCWTWLLWATTFNPCQVKTTVHALELILSFVRWMWLSYKLRTHPCALSCLLINDHSRWDPEQPHVLNVKWLLFVRNITLGWAWNLFQQNLTHWYLDVDILISEICCQKGKDLCLYNITVDYTLCQF